MKQLIILGILFCSAHLQAQNVFTYGNNAVTKDEFVRAYNKNASGEKATEQSYRDYLALYSRFKLKVQAAYDKKMDTLPGQVAELQNFRAQIADSYMNDDSSLKWLVDEAFQRSQKDIRAAHIFIPYYSNTDTLAAYKKAMQAYKELGKGADFAKVAVAYSSDSASLARGGELGYITVFTLPYAFENIIYATAPGKFARPYRSRAGYHIFKNMGERKALGKTTAAQILLLFPPDATEQVKIKLKEKADSLYKALQKGSPFNELAEKFSDDIMTYQSGGQLPPFPPGSFEPEFEEQVNAISKDGGYTKPILTADGYHIVKRISVMPVNTNKDNAEAMSALSQQVRTDTRINLSRDIMVKKAWQLTKLNKDEYDETKMLAYYKEHLDEYNADYALQVKEFKEGNLLFEVMQSTVWEKASGDSVSLKKYYEAHKTKYQWEPSADVIIFTCTDPASAVAMRSSFSINTAGWRDLVKENETKVQADSGRYELSQLPITDPALFKAGIITPAVENKGENTTLFVYIKKLYPNSEPRAFSDARGFVLNDYQAELEEKWVSDLQKQYPVKVNEEVFKGL